MHEIFNTKGITKKAPLYKCLLKYTHNSTVIKSLPVAVGCGDDLDMRYEMSVAAYKAGMAFNALSCEKGYAELAVAMGIKRESMTRRESCNAVIQMVRNLVQDLGLPNTLTVYNVNAGDFPQLAERAMQDICLIGNPRQVTAAQIVVLLNHVLAGEFPGGYS